MNSQPKRARSRVSRPHKIESMLSLVAVCLVAGCVRYLEPLPTVPERERPQDPAPRAVATQVSVSTAPPAATLALSPTFPPLITPTPSLTPTPTATALPPATATETVTRMATPTRTPWPTLTPTPEPTVTPTRVVTYTATLTHTAINPGPTPPTSATPTPEPAQSPTPTWTVEPTVALAAEPSVPVLIWPVPGKEYANPITFRWEGRLRPGETFQVNVRHGETGQRIQTSPMLEREWTYALPKEWVGAWWWSVWVVRDGQVLVLSPEWSFWLNPHQGPGPQPTSAPQTTPPPRTRQVATSTSTPTRPPLGN